MNDADDLRDRYSTLANDELVALHQRKELTNEAREILDSLIRERKIDIPSLEDQDTSGRGGVDVARSVDVRQVGRNWLGMLLSLVAPYVVLYLGSFLYAQGLVTQEETVRTIWIASLGLCLIAFCVYLVRTVRGLHGRVVGWFIFLFGLWGLGILAHITPSPIVPLVPVLVLGVKIIAAKRATAKL